METGYPDITGKIINLILIRLHYIYLDNGRHIAALCSDLCDTLCSCRDVAVFIYSGDSLISAFPGDRFRNAFWHNRCADRQSFSGMQCHTVFAYGQHADTVFSRLRDSIVPVIVIIESGERHRDLCCFGIFRDGFRGLLRKVDFVRRIGILCIRVIRCGIKCLLVLHFFLRGIFHSRCIVRYAFALSVLYGCRIILSFLCVCIPGLKGYCDCCIKSPGIFCFRIISSPDVVVVGFLRRGIFKCKLSRHVVIALFIFVFRQCKIGRRGDRLKICPIVIFLHKAGTARRHSLFPAENTPDKRIAFFFGQCIQAVIDK